MFKSMIIVCCCAASFLQAEIEVLAFSGSLRKDSVNQKLVNEASRIAREMGAHVQTIELSGYSTPFYDADLEIKEGLPIKIKELQALMVKSQVILIASPEYNGSVSGILKNTIDWLSRGEKATPSREAFAGKKFVIMSASPSAGGGARGLVHLKAILENLGAVVVSKEVILPHAFSAFDGSGKLTNEDVKKQLEETLRPILVN